MTETFAYQIRKSYFKLIKSCLKGNKKKQHKWEQKLIELELARKKHGSNTL